MEMTTMMSMLQPIACLIAALVVAGWARRGRPRG